MLATTPIDLEKLIIFYKDKPLNIFDLKVVNSVTGEDIKECTHLVLEANANIGNQIRWLQVIGMELMETDEIGNILFDSEEKAKLVKYGTCKSGE